MCSHTKVKRQVKREKTEQLIWHVKCVFRNTKFTAESYASPVTAVAVVERQRAVCDDLFYISRAKIAALPGFPSPP